LPHGDEKTEASGCMAKNQTPYSHYTYTLNITKIGISIQDKPEKVYVLSSYKIGFLRINMASNLNSRQLLVKAVTHLTIC
jgi:hypothetical protein